MNIGLLACPTTQRKVKDQRKLNNTLMSRLLFAHIYILIHTTHYISP